VVMSLCFVCQMKVLEGMCGCVLDYFILAMVCVVFCTHDLFASTFLVLDWFACVPDSDMAPALYICRLISGATLLFEGSVICMSNWSVHGVI
jgi:hypothetical protein